MRSALPVLVVALTLSLAGLAWAADGNIEAAPDSTALPAAPIPYTKLIARSRPKPRPAAGGQTPAVSSAPPTVATETVAQPGVKLAPNQPIPPAELAAFVDGLVKDAMAREHVAGVTLSVVQNGQIVLKKGYGFASLSPARAVDPDRTGFRIGSISKTFTWIALMKEVEARRIRLDGPINLYLPEQVRIPDKGFAPIRVLDLMDHSPGFEDRALGQLFETNYDRVRPLDVYLRQERPKRVRPPGEVSSYSNYGAALAGAALAWTSGKPYEQLIQDEILTPARMSRTTFYEQHPARPGLPPPMAPALTAEASQGFHWRPSGYQPRPYEFIEQIAPAGAASSTAADMARYMLLQLAGGSLDGATVYGSLAARAFRTPVRATPPGVNGWAHGLLVETLPGGHLGYGHDGGTMSFFSKMLVVPDLNLGLFISTNTDTGAPLARRFGPAIVRQFYGEAQTFARPGSPDLARQAGAFRGPYLGTRRAYGGLEGFVTRVGLAGLDVDVSPEGRLIVTSPAGVSAWVPEGPVATGRFIGAQDDQRLVFLMRDGRATAVLSNVGATVYERISGWRSPMTLAIFAGLTAAAAAFTIIGLITRNRRDLRQSAMQARASVAQNIQAALWIAAFALFGVFAAKSADDLSFAMYSWPGALVILASACALVAALLTLVTIAGLPAIWNGGQRVESWSYGRKLFFTFTVMVYAGFSVLLATWGALFPWNS